MLSDKAKKIEKKGLRYVNKQIHLIWELAAENGSHEYNSATNRGTTSRF